MSNPPAHSDHASQLANLDEEIAGVQRHLSELSDQHGNENHTALTACRARLEQLQAKRKLMENGHSA